MKTKIFRNLFSLSAIAIVFTTVMISFIMYNGYYADMEAETRQEAQYIAMAVELSGNDYLNNIKQIAGNRITLIDETGEILFDNRQNPELMANHSDRPEFSEALEKGRGESVRMSDTLGKQTFYCAVKLESGDIIRVANTTSNVYAALAGSIPYIVLICIVVFIVTAMAAKKQTSAIVAPINEINLEEPLNNNVYNEFAPLLRKMEQQNRIIQKTVSTLKKEREEFQAITLNMKEGLIVLNAQGEMLMVNQKACEIFGKTGEGHYLTLNRSVEFREVAEKALKGQHAESRLHQDGKLYQLIATPTIKTQDSSPKTEGVVVLALDITDQEETERIRREFSANVSHELRTPLTSISGYAEIIKEGIAKQEDVVDFASKIYTEAKRMVALVDDIMKLSRLDEGGISIPSSEIDLHKICNDTVERLKGKAAAAEVTLEFIDHSVDHVVPITGVQPMLEEVVSNLCDNAIKYNHRGGSVKVELFEHPVRLVVADTGIGIPVEHQSRVFERFYRVDKSHSKDTGGTGLGLSIVKHIVKQHHAVLRLHSQPDKGTIVEIDF